MVFSKGIKSTVFSIRVFLMRSFLIAQAVVSILLVASILLQNRGSGLGSAFGSDFGGYHTKRGIEKFLLYLTIFLSVTFLVLSVLNIYFSSGIEVSMR